jgi:hypothetical protein
MLSIYEVLKYLKEYGVIIISEHYSSKSKLPGTCSLAVQNKIQTTVFNVKFM